MFSMRLRLRETRLDDHSEMIREMYKHLLDMPLTRLETTEHELETLRARVVSSVREISSLYARARPAELRDESSRVSLGIARAGLTELRRQTTMPTTQNGMSSAAVEQLIAQHVAEAITSYETTQNNRNGNQNKANGGAGGVVHTARGSKPTRLEDEIKLANSLIDQKVRDIAARQAENKRRWENNPRDNHVQQPPPKSQNVARAYTARPRERKVYVGILPTCNKCKMHHTGPCTAKCGNCKRVGHMTRDCRSPIAATNQRALVANQRTTVTCYECGKQGYYKC
ncbi:reverse transcriptase domain-containing protein [Tanacetum coccineum]